MPATFESPLGSICMSTFGRGEVLAPAEGLLEFVRERAACGGQMIGRSAAGLRGRGRDATGGAAHGAAEQGHGGGRAAASGLAGGGGHAAGGAAHRTAEQGHGGGGSATDRGAGVGLAAQGG